MDKLEELRSALFQVTPDEVKDQEVKRAGIIAEEICGPEIGLSSTNGTIDTITIDTSSWSGLTMNTLNSPLPSYTIKSTSGPQATLFPPGYTVAGSHTLNPGLHVTSDAEFDGDIKWKGRSLGTMLETIEARLSILQPDPAKLEKFEALKKAYDHYKLMEKLCHDDPKPTE
jgi:hypothetical protein